MAEEILINTLYTGDYTNKNIGHEIINLYKTDAYTDENGENKGSEVYIYVTPYGFFSEKHNIGKILLTRSAGKNLTEIVAIIKEPELLYEDNDMPKQPPIFSCKEKYFRNKKKDKDVFQKFKNLCLKNDEQYIKWENFYVEWKKSQINNIENKKSYEEKGFCISDKSTDENIKKSVDIKRFEVENPDFDIEEALKDRENWKDKFKEWLNIRSRQHLQQIKQIVDNKIMYNGVYLHKILSKNLYNNKTLYFTFKAKPENIFKPKTLTFLKTLSYIKDIPAEYINFTENVENNNKKTVTYNFENIEFRPQRCYSFITEEHNKQIKEAFEEITDEKNLDNFSFDNNKTTKQNSFLDILGMQYDEVCYSNMFAYFFNKYPELFVTFAKDILKVNDVSIDNTFEIRREESRIDLLIITDNHVFVIENKIKAKIHGENYDKNKNEYTNQLIKYHNNIENNSDLSNKEKHYYIFKPKYNNVSSEININEILERFGDKISDTKDFEEKINYINTNIVKKYKNITFEEIYDSIEKFSCDENERIYFNEFLKAIKKHSSDYDNTIENDMKYKFDIAIQNVKLK